MYNYNKMKNINGEDIKINIKKEKREENYSNKDNIDIKYETFKYSRNLNNFEKNTQSENRLINIRNEIENKESVQTELSEKEDEFEHNKNNKNINENKKGIFSRGIDWINGAFKEFSLLWKSEELVDAYDANGNLVKRPKNKIPVKSKQNKNDPYEEKIADEVKSSTLNYAQDGINYGALFT